jgi:hypothetical protein
MEQMLLNYKQHGEHTQWLEMFQYLLHHQPQYPQIKVEGHKIKDYDRRRNKITKYG